MSYVINKTDGSVLSTPTMPSGILADGTTDTSTGLTLIGRNFPNYGDAQNENFVRLLENFADVEPPTSSLTALNALVGTLWYDTSTSKVRVYDGTNWNTINGTIVANAAPTSVTYSLTAGDQWYDSVNEQLYLWNSTAWVLIGPQHAAAQAKSGTYVETITDTTANIHTVVIAYTGENVVSITSNDPEFTPSSGYPSFGSIKPGLNLPSYTVMNGKAENSVRVGGVYANVLARTDVNTTFAENVAINKNLTFTNANVYYSGSSLVLQNNAYLGGLGVFLNTNSGNIGALQFDGSTGLGTVYGSPTAPNGIATKNYVDTQIAAINSDVTTVDGDWKTQVSKLRLDTGNYMTANVSNLNTTIVSVQSGINNNVTALSDSTNSRFAFANANAVSQQTSINSINATLLTLAPLASPTLTGSPRVPTASPLTRSTIAASTAYVDTADDVLRAEYTALIDAERAARIAGITNGTDGFALINSQTFTGTPRVPTPGSSDNSTRIASTAFVRTITDGLAPLYNPSFSGTPWAPTQPANTNSTVIATTEYSDRADSVLQADYNNKFATEVANRNSAIATALVPYAPIASPALTGNPTAPTQAYTDKSTKLATTAFVHSVVPTGAIIMWGGSVASIPAGWALCNGLNGTPDLRDRFIVGAGSSYAVGATGGANSTTLTEMPAHTHTVSVSGGTSAAGAHSHRATSSSYSSSSSRSTSSASVNDPGHSHRIYQSHEQGGSHDHATYPQTDWSGPFYYNTEPIEASKTGISVSVSTTTSTDTVTSTNTSLDSVADHSHAFSASGSTSSTGAVGGVAVPTRPPYYALCYIQKVS